MNPDRRLCVFTLAGQDYGIEVHRVQEVLRGLDATRIPLADPAIRGLINLRGQIVMAVDLRRCLGILSPDGDDPAMNLVIAGDDGPVSLLVDKILDVIDVEGSGFEAPPANLQGPQREAVLGSYPFQGRLLLLLDPIAIIAKLGEQSPKTSFALPTTRG